MIIAIINKLMIISKDLAWKWHKIMMSYCVASDGNSSKQACSNGTFQHYKPLVDGRLP